MTRFAILIVLALTLAACGQPFVNAGSATRYTVTASLMQRPAEPAIVCWGMPLPDPPIGCGGPPVADLDLSTMPDAHRYRNGVVGVGTYRVVGTWRDGSLHLTEAPKPAPDNARTPLAECSQEVGERSPTDVPQGQKLIADENQLRSEGILVLELYMCHDRLFAGVAVADKHTVDLLNARYGPMQVAGWLQPVG